METHLMLDRWKNGYHRAGRIAGKNFTRFLELYFAEADCFTMRATEFRTPTYSSAMEDLLEPYRVKTVERVACYGYPQDEAYYRAHGMEVPRKKEHVYRICPEAFAVLDRYYDDIFLKPRIKLPKKKYEQVGHVFHYPRILEDLCFFKDRTMILGTLSHEGMCDLWCDNPTLLSELHQIGDWRDPVSPQLEPYPL